MVSKRIIVVCDGTGADANAITIPVGVGFPIGQWATNVVRLARAVKPTSSDGKQQLVFYQSGVGSVTDFNANTVFGTTTTQMTGLAVATKIREAYAFIAQNFTSGDEVCLFGFSRGAYTARKIAELIDKLGLLKTEELGNFFQWWSMLVKGEKVTSKPGRDTKIRCVGVWDTVGSIAGVVDALHLKDNDLPASVDTALQAVSLQENRETFWPTLWAPPAGGLASGQTLTEVWFPGAHCDVGGGYEHHELADLALFWMADQLQYSKKPAPPIVDLDLGFIWKSRQSFPQKWGTSQPHNAWEELPAGLPKTRLDLCQSKFLYHESIKSAPTKLDHPFEMITLDDLKAKFRKSEPSWDPTCPKLGEFEAECKANWDSPSSGGLTFENSLDLFGPVIWIKSDQMIPTTEMIQCGMASSNAPMCVARVSYADGIHPGKATPTWPRAWFGYGGQEYSTTDYEVLIGPEKFVRWVPVSGALQLKDLNGAVLVPGGHESDGTALYIARYNSEGGKVRIGGNATYSYSGSEITATSYEVLVYNNLEKWTPSVNNYRSSNSSARSGNSQTVRIARMPYPPKVAVGLNKLDIGHGANLRVIAYVDGISTTSYTSHVDTWADTTLYNAGLSSLALASNDPDYQCGSWNIKCNTSATDPKSKLARTIVQRVNFNAGFSSQPKVFVGISGIDLAGDWFLEVCATDVDQYGFTIHVVTANNTTLYGIQVDWIAYLATKKTICNGVFTYGGENHIDFGVKFSNPPTIFTALTQFDISNGHNLRVTLDTTKVLRSGMDVSIATWSDTILRSVTGAYLAIDVVEQP